jgi:hypothetical protein
MIYLKARLWIFLDRWLISVHTKRITEHDQSIEVIMIRALFPWRCAAMIDEIMFETSLVPRRVFLNGCRLA